MNGGVRTRSAPPNLHRIERPHALKIPARKAEYSLTENVASPFQAEPRHKPDRRLRDLLSGANHRRGKANSNLKDPMPNVPIFCHVRRCVPRVRAPKA